MKTNHELSSPSPASESAATDTENGSNSAHLQWGHGAKRIVLIAGAHISYLIGAGIASGQEAMQYFASHGLLGIASIALVIGLFGWILASVTDWGRRQSPANAKDPFVAICGKWLGTFLKICVPFFIFSIAVTMVAGSGALFESVYGLPVWVGAVVLAVVLAATLILGFRRLVEIIGRVGPILIIFIGVISIWILVENFSALSQVTMWIDEFEPPQAMDNLFLSTLFYCSSVLLLAVQFLSSLGNTVGGSRTTAPAGWLSSIAFGGVLLISSLALLVTLPLIHDASTPLVLLGTQIAPWIGTAFMLVTFLAMYSTAAPMLWTIADQLPAPSMNVYRLIALILCLAALIGALAVPFGALVGFIYPFIGVFGVLFLVCFAVSQIRGRIQNQS